MPLEVALKADVPIPASPTKCLGMCAEAMADSQLNSFPSTVALAK